MEWLGQKEDPVGKGWAAGAGYGGKILAILKGILGTAGGVSTSAPEVMGGYFLAERGVQVAGECEEMCG